jgi:hypothetical protein
MVENVVIDTNLVIDLEEKRDGWKDVQKLIDFHNQQKIRLVIPAIMASEKYVNKKLVNNFKDFKLFVENLGFMNIEFIPPMLYFGMGYLNYGLYSGKDMQELERKIFEIIFPKQDFLYEDFCLKRNMDPNKIPLNKEWINHKCDTQMIWSLVYHKKLIFLTRNTKEFQKNKDELEKLGNFKIMTPEEFLEQKNG